MKILSVISSKNLSEGGPIYLCNSQKKFLSQKCYIRIYDYKKLSLIKTVLFFFGYKKKK